MYDDEQVPDSDCLCYQNFQLLPEHLERLKEVIRLQEELDPNRGIPAFKPGTNPLR